MSGFLSDKPSEALSVAASSSCSWCSFFMCSRPVSSVVAQYCQRICSGHNHIVILIEIGCANHFFFLSLLYEPGRYFWSYSLSFVKLGSKQSRKNMRWQQVIFRPLFPLPNFKSKVVDSRT